MMDLREIVEFEESNFDPGCNLLAEIWKSPGYHTRIPNGVRVHQTRSSIYYALLLLAEGEMKYRSRAEAVIRRVLSSQVTDPCDPAFGIWPWLDEEPVSRMAPPDWNWADFIGAGLCHILREYRDRITPKLAGEIEMSLRRAAWSIFRRNVQPNYTNIAIMGAAVTGVAGELLAEPLLLEYARRRLRKIIDDTHEVGGLTEYNSPNYTFIALFETERILQLSTDPELTATAEELRHFIWGEIASHFHPATGQLGGAQSRAYREFLPQVYAEFLSEATGARIVPAPAVQRDFCSGVLAFDGICHRPCPPELAGRFRALPEAETELVQRYVKREPDSRSTRGTTFLTPDLVLGSVSDNCCWVQSRPLLGYWVGPDGTPAMFRARFLKDGVDFSSGNFLAAQSRNRILCGTGLIRNFGDYHPTLDRPADGVFEFRRLAFRFDLAGKEAEVHSRSDGRFELLCGSYKVLIFPGEGRFGSQPIRVETGSHENRAWMDLVFYDGPVRREAFDESLVFYGIAGIEVLPAAGESGLSLPAAEPAGNFVLATWAKLKLKLPIHPVFRD